MPRASLFRVWMKNEISAAAFLAAWMTSAAGLAQPTELPGLRTEALVVEDADGIPHICSGSVRDTYFMQGYVHARDRFFQMDTLRRTFSGTLAEILGSGALGSDVELRTLGLRRAAQASFAAYQASGLDEALEMLDAYTAGVNAYLAGHPLPPEYGPLELTAASPWSPIDSLAINKGLAFSLSFDLVDIDLTVLAATYAQAGAAGGFDGLALLFEDVSRSAPFDATVSIPPAASTSTEGTASKRSSQKGLAVPGAAAVELARRYRDRAAAVPLLQQALERRGDERGSNWWMVAAERSASGHPILANDPHLGLDTPSIFYEAHLVASAEPGCGFQDAGAAVYGPAGGKALPPAPVPVLNVNGVSFAGTPGVVLGCNPAICWGATTNPMDVTDVYQEVLVIDPGTGLPTHTLFEGQPEPLVPIPQTFFVNQVGDLVADNLADAGLGPLDGGLTLVVPRRNHGPIVALDASQLPVTALSVQYTGWGPTFEMETFRRWQQAAHLAEFVDGMQFFDVGSQNWAYADVHGNIAYFTSAEMPIREDLQTLGFPDGGIPPFMIRDGTHGLRHEWLPVQNPQPRQALPWEILPFAEMPQVVNPAAGYVINANNDPVGTTLDNDPLNQVRPGGGLFYLSPGYADGLRVGRIGRLMEDLLADGHLATADDLRQMQANHQLLDAELVLPHLIRAFANASAAGATPQLQSLAADPAVAEAVTRLMAWDYSTPTGLAAGYDPGDDPDDLPEPSAGEVADSVAATIWSVFRGQLIRFVVDDTLIPLGLGPSLPNSGLAYNGVAHLLETFDETQGIGASGVDFFANTFGTREQRRDEALLVSLRSALTLLAGDSFAAAFGNSADQDDYRWGRLHRIVFDHPLGGPFSVPPGGGFAHLAPGLTGVARSGGYGAVDASSHNARADSFNAFRFGSGPARRFVGVLDPAGIDAGEVIPGGQSGVLGSPHYASQLGRWLTNDYHPLRLTAGTVRDAAAGEQQFTPLCVPGAATLCFHDRRFRVSGSWQVPMALGGPTLTVAGASDVSGNLFFFDPENWEILVKVLDGCGTNGHYWVFVSGATNLAWELTIEDTESGEVWTGSNPFGQRSPAITDIDAFATCP